MKNFKLMTLALAGMSFILFGCKSNNSLNPTPDDQPEQENTVNSRVIMRAANVNGNEWALMPEYPTQAEIDRVMALIGANAATVANFPEGCTEFIIQHLAGAHHMYSYTDWNGALHNNIDGTSSQEFFQILENSGSWTHLNNFNAGKCDNAATHNAVLMNDGFNGARTLNEYASSDVPAWRIFLIDGCYYLGIDFSAKKGDGEIPADGIYDDWVVKIIPLNGTPTPAPTPDPEPTPDPDPEDPTDPDEPTIEGAHVEFDIHQQEHTTWKEIKTSVHLRDTVDFTVLLPIPEAYQAEADDFDIRLGEKYEYLAHSITLVDKTYEIVFSVTHKAEGIEVFVKGSECAEALRVARALKGDGLTFEVHTYVTGDATDEQVWNWLKTTAEPTTTPSTTLIGQITSAFYSDRIDFGK